MRAGRTQGDGEDSVRGAAVSLGHRRIGDAQCWRVVVVDDSGCDRSADGGRWSSATHGVGQGERKSLPVLVRVVHGGLHCDGLARFASVEGERATCRGVVCPRCRRAV